MAEGAGINISRVLGGGFDALIRNGPAFLGLSVLLVGLPVFFSQYWVMSQTLTGALVAGSPLFFFLNAALVGTFVPFACDALLQGFVASMTIDQLSGRPRGAGRSISAALRIFVPLVILSILVGLIITIGLMLVIVPGVIFYLVLIVAVPAMVAERKSVIQSMVRSEALTSGSKGMIFLIVMLFFLLSIVVGSLAGMLAPLATDIAGLGFAASALTGAVSQSIRSAVYAAIVASLYVELRSVKESGGNDGLAEVFE